MVELKFLKEILNKNNYSCVISNNNEVVYTSIEKGVKPLLDFYKNFKGEESIYIADKIIGRGAAFLVILLSAKGLYTPVISESALDLLKKYSIPVEFEKIVPYINNRAGDGRCPIESVVLDEENPMRALEKIKSKLNELMEMTL